MNRRDFVKRSVFGALQFGVLNEWYAADPLVRRKGLLPRCAPEDQQMSAEALLNFVNAVDEGHLHSLMILKNGYVVAEGWWAPYAPQLKHTLYSLSKSFTSTAIGFAVSEGAFSVGDKVTSFFPDKLPENVNEHLAAMRVRDLLTMTTGHGQDTTGHFRKPENRDWVKAFLAQPVSHTPGTHFVYNSGATYMLSAILQKVTGQTLLDYLAPRLFKPLNISGADWETDPKGIHTGGWGLRVKTEDIAKFGQLYLQEGRWEGKAVLPGAWIKEATSAHIMQAGDEEARKTSDWLQGYGYQFWRCRHQAYRGDGAYGQYCIVIPERQMVVAINSETNNMQRVLDQVWDHLLADGGDQGAGKALNRKLKSLALPIPKGEAGSPLAVRINGSAFRAESNALDINSMKFRLENKYGVVEIADKKGVHAIPFGINEWKEGKTRMSIEWLKLIPTPIPGDPFLPTMASAFWKDPQTLEITCRFTDTAHYMRLTCAFEEDALTAGFTKSTALFSSDGKPTHVLKGSRIA